ncbi:RluA family pseudouridine synthase [Lacticaseibacillus absianus]|uniref:RluA family pseudouridine synthase n=1 Tax=Lacticaseibacillus absianus TaxID=2729623 RepID=UPI0015C8152A|nr:RluA family pseudouridine synthase [Lacticaseibacillus absianus]
MPEFTLHATATDAPSVRALLTQWRVPKHWRHTLRTTQMVQVAGHYRHFNEPTQAGEPVTLHFSVPPVTTYRPDPGPLDVVYEDAQLLIVNKPAGMKPHPNQPGEGATLMNRVAAYLAPSPAFITHRLDMATSGLTLIAKDPLTQSILNQQLGDKTMARSYTALVPSGLAASGTITAPIGRDPDDRRKRQVRADGDAACTHYTVIARGLAVDRLHLTLETGRTHQLRVHLAALGYPIIGDPLYAPAPLEAPRLMLHASELTLVRPLTTSRLTVTSPVPF